MLLGSWTTINQMDLLVIWLIVFTTSILSWYYVMVLLSWFICDYFNYHQRILLNMFTCYFLNFTSNFNTDFCKMIILIGYLVILPKFRIFGRHSEFLTSSNFYVFIFEFIEPRASRSISTFFVYLAGFWRLH